MSIRGFGRGRLAALGVVVFGVAVGAAPALAAEWAGLYGGLHAGGAWGNVDVTDDVNDGVPPGPFPYSAVGALGGGTAGFNIQMKSIVLGVEGDIGYMDLTGAGIIPSSDPQYHQDTTLSGGLYGDVTARVGLSMGQTLLYGKGGFAFYNGQAIQVTTKPGFVPTGTGPFTGWTAGGGIEQFVNPNLSFKVEYQHVNFGSQIGNQTSVTDPPIGHVYQNWTDLTADSIKVGVNWHFGNDKP
jgi:outer membrane immunogenic protein